LVPGSVLRIAGVGLNPLRAGVFATLREMGADLEVENERIEGGEPVGDLVARHGTLHGIDVPAERAPSMIDEYPVLAVIAACAKGTTRMRGLKELRVKESDRLAATAALLAGNGVRVDVEGDDLIVHGTGRPPAGGGLVETHMDHRLAMSALVLGLASAEPVRVDDATFIDTSFPGFVALMNCAIGQGGSPALTAA
jgi:3-phosphoshikimate 1-carboxyvinyltransferase